jgi:hypothetical protein
MEFSQKDARAISEGGQKEKTLFARLLASELYVCFIKLLVVGVKSFRKGEK